MLTAQVDPGGGTGVARTGILSGAVFNRRRVRSGPSSVEALSSKISSRVLLARDLIGSYHMRLITVYGTYIYRGHIVYYLISLLYISPRHTIWRSFGQTAYSSVCGHFLRLLAWLSTHPLSFISPCHPSPRHANRYLATRGGHRRRRGAA